MTAAWLLLLSSPSALSLPLPLRNSFLHDIATTEAAAARAAVAMQQYNATVAHALAAVAALTRLAGGANDSNDGDDATPWELGRMHALTGAALWELGAPQAAWGGGMEEALHAVQHASQSTAAMDAARGSELAHWQLSYARLLEKGTGGLLAQPGQVSHGESVHAGNPATDQTAIDLYRQSLCRESPPGMHLCHAPAAAWRGGTFTAQALSLIYDPQLAGRKQLFERVLEERALLALAEVRRAAAALGGSGRLATPRAAEQVRQQAARWQGSPLPDLSRSPPLARLDTEGQDTEAALRSLRSALGQPAVSLTLQHQMVGSVDLELAAVAARRELVLALVRGGAGASAAVQVGGLIVQHAPSPATEPEAWTWARTLPLQALVALALQAFATEFVWYREADELSAVATLRDAAVHALAEAGMRDEQRRSLVKEEGGRSSSSSNSSSSSSSAVAVELGRWRHLLAVVGSYEPLGGARSVLPEAVRAALRREALLRDWRAERRPGSGSAGAPGQDGDSWDEEAEQAWESLIRVQVSELEQDEAMGREGAVPLPLHNHTMGQNHPLAADPVSAAVQAQYEQHPYPRWDGLPSIPQFFQFRNFSDARGRHTSFRTLRELMHASCPGCVSALTPGPLGDEAADAGVGKARRKLRVLVAGSGTGQQPISTAILLPHALVTAVELSEHSLAYARRKAAEHGLLGEVAGGGGGGGGQHSEPLAFFRGNLLDLPRARLAGGEGGEDTVAFDFIKCNGVLHHMDDPEAGLRALTSVLRRPEGVLHLGLYSTRAIETMRRPTMDLIARERARYGDGRDDDGIRLLRREVMLRRPSDPVRRPADTFSDWRSLSGTRDLVFHVHEHSYTPLQLRAMLRRAGLRFVGFDLKLADKRSFHAWVLAALHDDPTIEAVCRRELAIESAAISQYQVEQSLELWDRYEQAFPKTFVSMLSFYVQHATSV